MSIHLLTLLGVVTQVFPWDPIPKLNHFFSEETFPNVQHELSLTQLEVIFPHSSVSCLGEEANCQLTTT